MRHPCNKCGKYDHWIRDHNSDGSLPPHVKSVSERKPASYSTSSASSAFARDQKKNAISFNMAALVGSTASTYTKPELGPLVDDGAPYSAIGLVELNLLKEHHRSGSPKKLDPIPSSLSGHSHWQYGTGEHSSPARKILGSTVTSAQSESGRTVRITHLVLEGSSQWVIGRNVTRNANLQHIERNAIQFYADGEADYIPLTNRGFLSFIKLSAFVEPNASSVIRCLNGNMLIDKTWTEVKNIVDKVHKHVCGHANYTDYRLLLERNELWNDAVAAYVAQSIENCTACKSTAAPQPNRKVSISSLSKHFNEILCIDHFYLDEVRLMHCMDLVSRYSTALAVDSASTKDAVHAFEATWASQFWYPDAVQIDKAFQVGCFKTHLDRLGIAIRPVPPGRHSKNNIESKHRVIRSIYLKLKHAAGPEHDAVKASYKAVSISNDLYGNDTMSAFELAKGFTKPLDSAKSHAEIPEDI